MGVVRRTPMRAVRVVAAQSLTPRMRRLTLAGEDLVGVEVRPAQDAELVLTDASGRRLKRRYTIRHARPRAGEWDVDALLHGDGPGTRFAETAAPGDELAAFGPRGRLELRAAAWHLLVGDEASLPAIAAILEALPAAEPAVAIVEVGGASDELELPGVRYVHRDGRPAGLPDLLAAELGRLAPRPNGRGYLLGETRAMIALRPAADGLGVGGEALYLKGYWNRARHPGPRDHAPPGR